MKSLLILFTIHLLALMTPGPDFFIVTKAAITTSRRAATMTAMGVSLGVMVWAGVALVGLHLLLERVIWLRVSIKLAGGAYLVYLGILMFKASFGAAPLNENRKFQCNTSDMRAVLSGFFTNLSNPKAAVYFGSIFATFVVHGANAAYKMSMFLMVSLESLLWFVLVGHMFSLPSLRAIYLHAQTWIDRIAGVAFGSFGLHLILASKN